MLDLDGLRNSRTRREPFSFLEATCVLSEDDAAEVAPLAGNVFAFARSDRSWHGHPPFTGERYVVQTAFLRSQADLERKESSGGLQMLLKRVNPFIG